MLADPVGERVELAASVTSSSITGAPAGSRLAIRVTSVGRGNAVSTTVAPFSWAMRATWNAIEASVSTPVTRIRLPSRMPITNQLSSSRIRMLRAPHGASP